MKVLLAVLALVGLAGGVIILSNVIGDKSKDEDVKKEQTSYRLISEQPDYQPGQPAPYRFRIEDADGQTIKKFDIEQEKLLHLIVVRKDLTNFQHVHPELNPETGQFNLANLTFPTDGPYRVVADFVPSAEASHEQKGHEAGQPVTLTEDIEVGDMDKYRAQSLPSPQPSSQTAGYSVELATETGQLSANQETKLSFRITRSGTPVTNLERYLGSLGHAVVLSEDDLEYIHSHALTEADQTQNGMVQFALTPPRSGRYKVFFQFQHEGQVRTTEFVLNVTGEQATSSPASVDHGAGH